MRSPAQLEEKGRVYARCAVLAKRREMAAKERPAYGGALCAFVRVRSDLVLALVVGDDRAPQGEGVIRFGDVQVVHRVVRRRAAPILVALLAVGDGKSLKVHLAGALVKVVEEVNKYDNGDNLVIEDFIEFLKNWLINHIIVEDKKFIYELKNSLKTICQDDSDENDDE